MVGDRQTQLLAQGVSLIERRIGERRDEFLSTVARNDVGAAGVVAKDRADLP